jgi:two-component system KDP operon response regulator KdpE
VRGKRVLVIDDDAETVELVRLVFAREGAEVYSAAGGRAGIHQVGACRPHLVLLDVMMPDLDGWETCRLLRGFSDVPIIFLTALSREQDIVRGLDCGAADYVTKPFSARILLARARAALRARAGASGAQRPVLYDDGYLSVDLEARSVLVDGKPARLTVTEYRLLAYLLENRGRVLTYEQILAHVWGWEYRECVDYAHVYAWHLRRKLEPDPRRPAYVLTERGVGYRFAARRPNPHESAA